MADFVKKFLRLFQWRFAISRRYYINDREVSEAEWYINGGLEVEQRLDELERKFNRFKN